MKQMASNSNTLKTHARRPSRTNAVLNWFEVKLSHLFVQRLAVRWIFLLFSRHKP